MSKPVKKNKKHFDRRFWAIIAGTLLVVTIAVVVLLVSGKDSSEETSSDSFFQKAELIQNEPEQLCDGLLLQGVGSYTGIFLEDGSEDQVTDVMMIQLKNTGKKDLQLANLSLAFESFTAEFDITNLPAGATMVVLEKNRRPYVEQRYMNMALSNLVFFDKNLDIVSDLYEITGTSGEINLKNISNLSVEKDIYVSYKYMSGNIFYGGITFRAKLPGGLKPGETKQISAQHFHPEHCVVVQIRTGG